MSGMAFQVQLEPAASIMNSMYRDHSNKLHTSQLLNVKDDAITFEYFGAVIFETSCPFVHITLLCTVLRGNLKWRKKYPMDFKGDAQDTPKSWASKATRLLDLLLCKHVYPVWTHNYVSLENRECVGKNLLRGLHLVMMTSQWCNADVTRKDFAKKVVGLKPPQPPRRRTPWSGSHVFDKLL